MHNRIRNLRSLARSSIGRRELRLGLYYSALPFLGRVAEVYRRTIVKSTRVIAVVGSFGKTTTTRAIRTALGLRLDPHLGVTQPSFKAREVLRIRPRDRHAVIEAAVEGPGQMAFAARFIRPDIAVVTSIGSEHRRAFGSVEGTRNEKAAMVRILPVSGLAVLNGDDPNVLSMKALTRASVMTFGLGTTNDIYATEVSLDWPVGTRFVLHANGDVRSLRIRLIGRHMVYAALAAVAVAIAEGMRLEEICAALEALDPTPGRMEPVRLANGAIILRDDFKSPLETVEAALDTFAEIPASRRIIVLGQVSEAPGDHRAIQRHLGERVAQIASYAIFVGVDCRPYITGAVRGGLPRNATLAAGRNVSKIVETLRPMLREGDVVLIKGRASEKLDRIALALMGHRVACAIEFCDVEIRCSDCPMLERGWVALVQ
jgi:UDP-N-acetylmuramoyl-tripeptide--D-alanyl-D-alanine ligase